MFFNGIKIALTEAQKKMTLGAGITLGATLFSSDSYLPFMVRNMWDTLRQNSSLSVHAAWMQCSKARKALQAAEMAKEKDAVKQQLENAIKDAAAFNRTPEQERENAANIVGDYNKALETASKIHNLKYRYPSDSGLDDPAVSDTNDSIVSDTGMIKEPAPKKNNDNPPVDSGGDGSGD